MADFNSDQWAAKPGVATPGELGAAKDYNGRVRTAFADYTTDNTIAQGDRIRLFPVPALARITRVVVRSEAMGTGVTAEVGTDADDDRFLTATSVAAAGDIDALSEDFSDVSAGADASNVTLYLTLDGGDPSDSADISVMVEYVVT